MATQYGDQTLTGTLAVFGGTTTGTAVLRVTSTAVIASTLYEGSTANRVYSPANPPPAGGSSFAGMAKFGAFS